eukprot:GEMP01109705.1.p1 GENE.GEMP01109705.1~~GEMP01109705.1.p1  ORF type:complete len:107 (-),score=2.04 GEMP01109705.1:47-367(-)
MHLSLFHLVIKYGVGGNKKNSANSIRYLQVGMNVKWIARCLHGSLATHAIPCVPKLHPCRTSISLPLHVASRSKFTTPYRPSRWQTSLTALRHKETNPMPFHGESC